VPLSHRVLSLCLSLAFEASRLFGGDLYLSHTMAVPTECAFLGEGDVIDVAKEWHDEILVQIH